MMDKDVSLMSFNDLIHCIGLDATPFQIKRSIFYPISDMNYAFFENGVLPLRFPLDFLPAGMYGLSEQDVQTGIFFLNTNILNLFNPKIELIDGNHINGHNFYKPYIIGYNSGKAAFKARYAINTGNDRLNNFNVDNIKYAFSEIDPFTSEKENRWSNWLHKYPENVSHCEIAIHGFYAALYYETIELCAMYPMQFKDFFIAEDATCDVLEPIPAPLQYSTHLLPLLWELGVIDLLKERYQHLPANKKGRIIEFITKTENEEFRRPFLGINTTEYFSDESLKKAAIKCQELGIQPDNINTEIKKREKKG